MGFVIELGENDEGILNLQAYFVVVVDDGFIIVGGNRRER
jgi:hypothetical protein